jgi:hypothetical protein
MFSDDYGDDVPEWAVNKPEQVRQFRTRSGGYDILDDWIERNPNAFITPRKRRQPKHPTARRKRQPLVWWEWALILAPFALILASIALPHG